MGKQEYTDQFRDSMRVSKHVYMCYTLWVDVSGLSEWSSNGYFEIGSIQLRLKTFCICHFLQ